MFTIIGPVHASIVDECSPSLYRPPMFPGQGSAPLLTCLDLPAVAVPVEHDPDHTPPARRRPSRGDVASGRRMTPNRPARVRTPRSRSLHAETPAIMKAYSLPPKNGASRRSSSETHYRRRGTRELYLLVRRGGQAFPAHAGSEPDGFTPICASGPGPAVSGRRRARPVFRGRK